MKDCVFSSNGIRLSARQWLLVGVIVLAALFFLPSLWQLMEPFAPGENYRLPYQLSSDYWFYDRYSQTSHPANQIALIGDSVIWGHYVSDANTLSAHLNSITGSQRFANFGLDGIHPAAIDGLLRYYTKGLTGRKIILHLNPLWFSSPKHDLQTDKEFTFNHPQLVPQFQPKITCYNASFSTRLSAVARRYVPILNWKEHLNLIFDISNLKLKSTEPNIELPNKTSDGPRATSNEPWVELQTSVQWRFFQRTIEMLKQRNNKIFVVIGPYNEHRLSGESLAAYEKLKADIESAFMQNKIDYCFPAVLPVELYIDASHPSSEGYIAFAQQLLDNTSFQKYLHDN
jgi:hypothetical protein